MTPSARFNPSLAAWSMAGLVAGVAVGILGQSLDLAAVSVLSVAVSPLGDLWMNALQMVVIPLVVTQLLAAMVRPGEHAFGALGGKALALMVAFLVGAGIFTLVVTSEILTFYSVSPGVEAAFRAQTVPDAALQAADQGPRSLGEWLTGLVPINPVESGVRGDLLQILVFTVLVGAAVSRLPEERRGPLANVFRSLADAMMILVSWILWGTPLGVFALMLRLSLDTGAGALGVVGVYVVLCCALLLLVTAILYPITAFFGRVSLVRFAKAVLPAQVVGASTQSSLASLPALVEGASGKMELPEESTGFVLPLCVASFKLNLSVSQPVDLLFLALVFGVPLGLGDIVAFMSGVILVSFGSPGVPRGVGFSTLPFYLMVGVPIEGVVIVEAVKSIPDIFFTVLNVTGDMSVATILSRGKKDGQDPSGSGVTMR